jgi:hypothetical protein
MLDLYTVLLTIHIGAIALWFGGGLFAFLVSRKLEGSEGVPVAKAISATGHVFPISAFVAALAGVGMWIDAGYGLDTVWLWIAVAGWLASGFIGSSRINPAVERWTGGDMEGAAAYKRFATIDLSILALVIADMVIKPFA